MFNEFLQIRKRAKSNLFRTTCKLIIVGLILHITNTIASPIKSQVNNDVNFINHSKESVLVNFIKPNGGCIYKVIDNYQTQNDIKSITLAQTGDSHRVYIILVSNYLNCNNGIGNLHIEIIKNGKNLGNYNVYTTGTVSHIIYTANIQVNLNHSNWQGLALMTWSVLPQKNPCISLLCDSSARHLYNNHYGFAYYNPCPNNTCPGGGNGVISTYYTAGQVGNGERMPPSLAAVSINDPAIAPPKPPPQPIPYAKILSGINLEATSDLDTIVYDKLGTSIKNNLMIANAKEANSWYRIYQPSGDAESNSLIKIVKYEIGFKKGDTKNKLIKYYNCSMRLVDPAGVIKTQNNWQYTTDNINVSSRKSYFLNRKATIYLYLQCKPNNAGRKAGFGNFTAKKSLFIYNLAHF
jgi:hypothetical protein